MKGKFIVIYGANNLGKSHQLQLLEKSLQEKNISTKRIKYPIYDLEPTGPLINNVLRGGLHLPENDVQELYVKNRKDYEPQLKKYLAEGIWVLAEDYVGTGIAWGWVRGLSLEELEKMNEGLLKEDVAILLYGERFLTGKEKGHRNEQSDEMWNLAQQKHLFLADRYGWKKVYATRPEQEVTREIITLLP